MNISLNGQQQEISAGSTLEAIIIDITGSPIPVGLAVAVNYEVITRSAWSLTVLEEDDEIEILWASAGG